MSESKTSLTVQPSNNLTLVNQAEVSQLVYRSAEDTLVVGSTVIHRTETGMFSLNDLHKALGSPSSKRPNEFLGSKAAKETIAQLKERGQEAAYETVIGGANPGTYAHKLLAYEYATVLDKAFKVTALVILDIATNTQVNKVQAAYEAVTRELGEERAKRLETVEELGNAYQSLNREQYFNAELINMHRDDKRLNKDSPVVQELGLAKRNVQFMWAHLDASQRDLINLFDFLESLGSILEQEIKEKSLNNYYTKLLKDKIIDSCRVEAQNLKETLSVNTKVLNDAKQYLANASKFVSEEVRVQDEA